MPFWSSVNEPYWPLPSLSSDQVCLSLTSTSCWVNWPDTALAPSSVTSPVAAPVMVGASLVPLMVMTTWPVVPSALVTVKVSVRCSLAPNCWMALASLSSLKLQLPLASMENVPYLPWKSVCGLNVASPASLSTMSSLPLAVRVVSSWTVPLSSPGLLGVMTAASLVPVMSTVMVLVAVPPWPSSTVTVMVSVTFSPSLRAWTLSLVLSSSYFQLPLASTVNLPYWPSPLLLTVQVCVSEVSTSVTSSLPVALVAPSSATAPSVLPLSFGSSLVPSMVTVMVLLVPSAVVTVKVSTSFSPTARAWTLGSSLSSSYFQLPLASMENLPWSPLASVCGLKVASPASLSVTSSLPPVTRLPSSLTLPWSSPSLLGVMTAASLVPVMSTVMVLVAVPPWPSSTVTVMVSVTFWPSLRAWTLSLVLSSSYFQLPLASTVNLPYWPSPLLLTVQVCVSEVSTSVTSSLPVALVVPSSATAPSVLPLSFGSSLVPSMVTVMVLLVPSAVVTVKVSTSFSPTARAWTLGSSLSSSYFQLPLASIENLPCSPLASVCGLNVASPASLSVTSSLPPVTRLPSSLTLPWSSPSLLGVMTAASLVPVMSTVMVLVAVPPWPSSTVTVMVSVTFWPSASA
ncbi:Uncharacterised protein [Achromobacter xylosoxidans]|nr:Uncharacterised protein [Achromobacter xylosoxidans]